MSVLPGPATTDRISASDRSPAKTTTARPLARPDVAVLLPALVFLASAIAATLLAYHHGRASAKLWMILTSAVLAAAIATQRTERSLRASAAIVALIAVPAGLYFLAAQDWTGGPVKSAFLSRIGGEVSRLLPQVPDGAVRLHPNAVGGIMATLWPFCVALAFASGSGATRTPPSPRMRRATRTLWVAAAAFSIFVALLTVSRGAWLSFAVVAPLWWAWRMVDARAVAVARRKAVLILVTITLVALTALFLLVHAGFLPAGARLADRLTLQKQALSLARDYPFTGIGLRTFAAQYSVYTRLGHVRLVGHAHNLPLDLFLEQGPVGLASYTALLVVALRRGFRAVTNGAPTIRWLAEAAIASQVAILIHGIAGDPLYSSRGVLLLFVPIGVMLAAGRLVGRVGQVGRVGRVGQTILFVVIVSLAASVVWRHRLAGLWLANLGALAQSRVELSAYNLERFQDPTLDQVRRTHDLSAAIGYFEGAVAHDPANRTARQRLAELALSQKRYESALEHASACWHAGHRDEVTRVLLGDSLMANGRLDEAAALVTNPRAAGERLHGQAWYRYWIDGDAQRAANVWAVAVRLNPDDRRAADYLDAARQRIAAGRAATAPPAR